MKSFFIILFLLFTGFGSFAQKLPEKFYTILENKAIRPDTTSGDSLQRYVVTDGNNLVFHFRQQTKNFDKTIAYDAGYREDFYFQVPADTEDFELKGEKLKEAMAFSKPFCRCIPSWTFYDEGVIKGQKTDENEWEIDIHVKGSSPQKENQPHTLEASGIFRK